SARDARWALDLELERDGGMRVRSVTTAEVRLTGADGREKIRAMRHEAGFAGRYRLAEGCLVWAPAGPLEGADLALARTNFGYRAETGEGRLEVRWDGDRMTLLGEARTLHFRRMFTGP
ncbi:MAG: hypothetical protein AB1758_16700, partial [Candidatus Eremiobacterota bacterium]